jgi:hypothetical protein
LGYRFLPRTQAQIPKPNREVATAANGSGGSQTGTLCRWEGLTSAATSAAIATPKKIPRARFGCLRQATPHKARNRTRPLICSHTAITEKSSRWQDSWRPANPTHAPAPSAMQVNLLNSGALPDSTLVSRTLAVMPWILVGEPTLSSELDLLVRL